MAQIIDGYECGGCGSFYDIQDGDDAEAYDSAAACCPIVKKWQCAKCESTYATSQKAEAEKCCTGDEE